MRISLRFACMSLLLAAPLAACGDDATSGDPDAAGTGELTYYKDIKPIIDAKCVSCHFQGGPGPMSFETYDDVKTHAAIAKLNIHAGLMPPWPPNNDCDDYKGDRSLSQDQIDRITAWIDAGTPAGDPSDVGAPLEVEDLSLSRVDRTLAMAVPYTPTKTPDDYRCFLVPWTEETTTYVTGFRAVPGNPRIVHHVIAYLATPGQVATYEALDAGEEGPGYTCFGGTEGPARSWIGSWAPGGQGSDFPEGTGMRIEPGSMIILQVHYNVLENAPDADLTEIQLKLADTVDKEAAIMPWANPQWLSGTSMHIPPNQADVEHSFAFDATFANDNKPFRIHASSLHMHTLGTKGTLRINRANQSSECLLQIDDWNFHWQGAYAHREPKVFNQGDQLYLECHWDNTPENQPIVNGERLIPRDVYWGEGTQDEMCLGVLFISEL